MRAERKSRLLLAVTMSLLAAGALLVGAACGKEKGKASGPSAKGQAKAKAPLTAGPRAVTGDMAPGDPATDKDKTGPGRAAAREPTAAAPRGAAAAALSVDPAKLTREKLLTANRASIRSLQWSPDGTRLVAVSADNVLRLWDTVELRQRAARKGHEGTITSVAYSHDSKYIASGDDKGEVRTWLGNTAWKVQVIPTFTDPVVALGFNPAGRIVAVSATGAVSLRKPYTGKEVGSHTLQVPEGPIGLAAVSDDGALVAGVIGKKDIAVWEVASGTLKHRLTGYSDVDVLALVFSKDGKRLAIGWSHGAVRVHPLGESDPVPSIGPGQGKRVGALALSPDGTLLGWGLSNRTAQLYGFAGGRVLRTLEGHPGKSVEAVAFSPDGKRLATGGVNGVIYLWK